MKELLIRHRLKEVFHLFPGIGGGFGMVVRSGITKKSVTCRIAKNLMRIMLLLQGCFNLIDLLNGN